MPVLVNNAAGVQLPVAVMSAMENIAAAALKEMDISPSAEISLTLCDDKMIRMLNKTWRRLDEPTDVLSFPLLEEKELYKAVEELLLGDIVISLESTARQAAEYGHSTGKEILHLFTHGLLHLLGYDHNNSEQQQEMWAVEEKLLLMAGVKQDEKKEE